MSSVRVLQLLNAKVVQLQMDVAQLQLGVQGVDVLSMSAQDVGDRLDRSEVVSIAERVVGSATASLKSECTTVAKVEAGVTVRSMIPSIKADCASVARGVVGTGEDLRKIKADLEDVAALKAELEAVKVSHDALLERVDKLSAPRQAPPRKLPVKKVSGNDDAPSEPMVI
jgi:hypothetical protein